MGNRVVAAACAFLKANPKMTSFDDFLAGFANLPRVVPPDCVKTEIENIAKRELARRAEAAKPAEEIELEGGATARVIRADRSKPHPLTHFVHHAENYGDGRPRYFERRATKGWRWSILDDYEAKRFAEQGVKTLRDLPGRGEIRKRTVA